MPKNNQKRPVGLSKFGKIVAIAGSMALTATQASADLVAPTFDSADAITIGTAVITGYALIWGIKKAIQLAK